MNASYTEHLMNRPLPSALSDAEALAACREALLKRRGELLAGITLHEGAVSRVQHAREVLEQDADDAPARDADREVDLALGDQDRQELADIGAALQRLTDGQYGRCTDCDGSIPFERLRVRPQALRCIACEARHEARSGATQRLTL